eukprot:scaffold1690_cov182-Amphora_coffeaeformis.AAC.39
MIALRRDDYPSVAIKEMNLTKNNSLFKLPNDMSTTPQSNFSFREQPLLVTSHRLEFLHIQKNAGTLIEVLGIKHNLTWGACHFSFPWKHKNKDLKFCPRTRGQKVSRKVYWHYPLQYLPMDAFPMDPYDNIVDLEHAARPKKFFAVVRNPYERMVSFFYHNYRRPSTAAKMNRWIQEVLQNPKKVGLKYRNATICQYPYIYHEHGASTGGNRPRKMVDHLLHFENLAEDFAHLAQAYGLNVSIPSTKVNARKKNPNVYTSADLSNKTIDMLNRLCPKDFDLGRGYSMIQVA